MWKAPTTKHDASTNACLHKTQVVDQLLTNPDGYPRPKDYDDVDMEVMLESPMVGSRECVCVYVYVCMYVCVCIHPGEKLVDRYVVCAYIWCVSACIPLTSPPTTTTTIHTPQGGTGSSPYKRGGGKTAVAAEVAAGLEMTLEKMQRYIDVLRRAEEYKVSSVFVVCVCV